MREILEKCVSLDTMAVNVYTALEQGATDRDLATLFRDMAIEERAHVGWWTDLLEAWDSGLVPDIADQHGLDERLERVSEELSGLPLADIGSLGSDDALELAVQMEFFMLDSVFGELVDLMQPGNKGDVREGYARHVGRLVEAVEKHYTRSRLASFLAGVLKRGYRDQQRLAALSVRDELTGLLNRRGLLSQLSQWAAWSTRYGHPVGVILLDIDDFKRINDDFGHSAGDQALARVGDTLRRWARESDVVGRFGGDEFLILAPEADGVALEQLMDRLVQAISTTAVQVDGRQIFLSASVGAAWAPGGVHVAVDPLIAAADRSMYEAKASGRNRAGCALNAVSI